MNSAAKLEPNQQRKHDDRERAMIWFARHIAVDLKIPFDIYGGVTAPAQRVANVRKVIVEHGLTDRILGRYNDKPETFAAFAKRALDIDVNVPP